MASEDHQRRQEYQRRQLGQRLHYLCAGYKKFFLHIRKYLRAMSTLLENDLPLSYVMQAVKGPLVISKPGHPDDGHTP